ncbi:MAG: fructose-bisphosphate aldolase, class [Clostridiales bacterium]|nr:fructose-bisphosphate aldolase, class [Clostridiales bacterium]
MLVTMKELLDAANKDGYAVVAPNAWNEDSVKAVIRAAEKMKSPVIMALYPVMADIENFAVIARYYIQKTQVPIALHLDHSTKFEDAMTALKSGFTSVMVDRSQLAYADNVKEVAEIVKAAHALGVTVEAELGHVGQGVEYEATRDAGLTHPEEAASFIKDTGVDCLAVAVGTSHGVYKGVPKIDFDRLKAIKALVNAPLVLHGSSGTGDDNLKKCVELGINKINLFTDLNLSADHALRTRMESADRADIVSVCELLYNEYERELIRNMQLVRSDHRMTV